MRCDEKTPDRDQSEIIKKNSSNRLFRITQCTKCQGPKTRYAPKGSVETTAPTWNPEDFKVKKETLLKRPLAEGEEPKTTKRSASNKGRKKKNQSSESVEESSVSVE